MLNTGENAGEGTIIVQAAPQSFVSVQALEHKLSLLLRRRIEDERRDFSAYSPEQQTQIHRLQQEYQKQDHILQDRSRSAAMKCQMIIDESGLGEEIKKRMAIKNLELRVDLVESYLQVFQAVRIPHSNQLLSPCPKIQKRRANLRKDSKAVLQTWFDANTDCPYPNHEQKLQLAKDAQVEVEQITNWFINARVRNEWNGAPPPDTSKHRATRTPTLLPKALPMTQQEERRHAKLLAMRDEEQEHRHRHGQQGQAQQQEQQRQEQRQEQQQQLLLQRTIVIATPTPADPTSRTPASPPLAPFAFPPLASFVPLPATPAATAPTPILVPTHTPTPTLVSTTTTPTTSTPTHTLAPHTPCTPITPINPSTPPTPASIMSMQARVQARLRPPTPPPSPPRPHHALSSLPPSLPPSLSSPSLLPRSPASSHRHEHDHPPTLLLPPALPPLPPPPITSMDVFQFVQSFSGGMVQERGFDVLGLGELDLV